MLYSLCLVFCCSKPKEEAHIYTSASCESKDNDHAYASAHRHPGKPTVLEQLCALNLESCYAVLFDRV